MILKIFSIQDSKAAAHLPPFFMATTNQAMRTFSDCCNDKKHAFCLHPEDYTIFEHGSFDCDTGQFTTDAMFALANGTQLVKPSDPDQQQMHLEAVQ